MPVTVLRRGSIEAYDYRCDARRGAKPFPEVHRSMSVSYVRSGSFGYRARGKSFELVAGSVLVGHAQHEFTCTHDHAEGDECLSFHLAPEVAEEVADSAFWQIGCIPPLAQTAVLGELAQAAAGGSTTIAVEEAALLLTRRLADLTTDGRTPARVSPKDRKRAIESAEWIDANRTDGIGLAEAARAARVSLFHFLRVFTNVLGITPHQYLVRSRLRLAASLLARSDLPVTEIALASGFGDLANFTRTFGRAAGRSPAAFRNFCKAPRRPAR